MAAYHATGFARPARKSSRRCQPAAAEKAATKRGIGRVPDVAEMLRALPELDAVSIIVPNKFHAPSRSRPEAGTCSARSRRRSAPANGADEAAAKSETDLDVQLQQPRPPELRNDGLHREGRRRAHQQLPGE